MKRWILALIAIWSITALIGSQTGPIAAQDVDGSVYFALGDSLSAGLGSSLPRERGYAALVAEWLDLELPGDITQVNLARPGETIASFRSDGQLDRFREQVNLATDSGLAISTVSLSLGGNAILAVQQGGLTDRQAALDAFASDYPALLQDIRAIAPDAPLIVTNVYDPTAGDASVRNTDSWWIAQFNQVISQAAASVGAQVADVSAAFEGRDDLTYYPLDVHPTNAGHRVIAQTVFAAIGLDTTPPEITIDAPANVSRKTPTVTISLEDATEIQVLSVTLSEGWVSPAIEVERDKHVVLLDLNEVESESVTLSVIAADVAGNTAERDVSITLPR